ncbi:ATP-binding protein [uncultured Cohaesibacter sp.]|uniref:ATP-binding protein n=1 Tax=uncultured Cohaesibacter sp. TaxID=1002546 RepID=UPI002931316B|nr:ATP-binding protein [uncultured Cohaesibacter sp.]
MQQEEKPQNSSGFFRRNGNAVVAPIAFLGFALGAFSLTMQGVWVVIGALLWLLSGALFTRLATGYFTDPVMASEKEAELSAQMQQLDMACESLLDQNWELRETEQKYQALLNRQGDIILHLDDADRILYCNDPFATYFDRTDLRSPFAPNDTLQESDASEGNSPGIDPLWEREIDTLIGPRWFRWTETLVRSVQKEKEMRLVIARDVTAFKQMEAASEAKSRFLATISHEMRTPLNGIIGMANLLQSTALSDEQANYTNALRQSGTALLALVNDVLDLSRIEAGKLTLSHEWTSPIRLMEEVVELLAPDAQDKGLSIASWVSPDMPAKLLIDPARVRQILVNLVGNAIKFTAEGAINLALHCEEPLQEGEAAIVLLSVRDTGPGIEEAIQSRLFEEFEQADTTRTRQHEGSGLGLAISRRLARMMEGDILLKSVPGKGSTFSLRIPASWLDDADGKALDAPLHGDDFAKRLKGTVLVGIDLTEADRRALFSYCKDWGVAFYSFTLGQWEETGQTICPDHLLINGAEPDKAMKIIASFDPLQGGRLTRPQPRSRIVLLEPGERGVIPQMRNSGINAYLVKPVRQISLRQALLGHPDLRTKGSEALTPPTLSSPASETSSQSEQDACPKDNGSVHPENNTEAEQVRILLVEDNEINILLARSALEKAGMSVAVAPSGKEALGLYRCDHLFDLALVDLHMPDMDGLDLFDKMQDIDSQHERLIPKLAFTADALPETRESCLSRGFSDFIVKPIDPLSLVKTVQAALDKVSQCHKTVL